MTRPKISLKCLGCSEATTPRKRMNKRRSTSWSKKKGEVHGNRLQGGKVRALLGRDDAKKAAELSGPKYVWTDDCPEKFELGKAFLPDFALDEAPWEMRTFHKWYMEPSKKGLTNLTIRSPANALAGEGFFWLDFSDLCAIYHREKMDVNYVAAWCL